MENLGIILGLIGTLGLIITFIVSAFNVDILFGMFVMFGIIFSVGFGIYSTTDDESEKE